MTFQNQKTNETIQHSSEIMVNIDIGIQLCFLKLLQSTIHASYTALSNSYYKAISLYMECNPMNADFESNPIKLAGVWCLINVQTHILSDFKAQLERRISILNMSYVWWEAPCCHGDEFISLAGFKIEMQLFVFKLKIFLEIKLYCRCYVCSSCICSSSLSQQALFHCWVTVLSSDP